MSRWTWVSLVAALAAGMVTARSWCRLLAHNMAGLPPRAVEPELVASALLPTGLLAAAALVCLVQVLTIRGELAAEWRRSTGLTSFLALVAGDAVAAVVPVAAVVAAAKGGPTPTGGGPRSRAGCCARRRRVDLS